MTEQGVETKLSERQLDGFRKAFDIFDKDGSGYITAAELAVAIKSLGHPVSPDELQPIVQEVEPDNDGSRIIFSTFVSIMMRTIQASKSDEKKKKKDKKKRKEFVKSMSSIESTNSSMLTEGDVLIANTDDNPPTESAKKEKKKKKRDIVKSKSSVESYSSSQNDNDDVMKTLDNDGNGTIQTEESSSSKKKKKDKKNKEKELSMASATSTTHSSLPHSSSEISEDKDALTTASEGKAVQPQNGINGKRNIVKSMSSASSYSTAQVEHDTDGDGTIHTQDKSRKSVGSLASANSNRSLSRKKSRLLPSRGTRAWVLGEDNEWRMCLLEKVKKPVMVNEKKVVALHVLMDKSPKSSEGNEDQIDDEGEHKTILTHFDNEDETEYTLLKRSSLLSVGEDDESAPRHHSASLLQQLDIPILDVINEPELLHFLRGRYNAGCKYFGVGPLMIALTVHKRSGSACEAAMSSIPYFPNNDTLMHLDSGVVGLVHKMCAHLCPLNGSSGATSSTTKIKNQSVVLFGESGSGKSTLAREISQHIVGALANSSETPVSDVRISDDDVLQHVNCILELFGHAQTSTNPNSSRYSKNVKFSVDNSGGGSGQGGLRGVLVRSYSIELERVSQCPDGECNFNVFYDVFDDIFYSDTAAEKFGIEDIVSFKYTPMKPSSRLNEPGKSPFRDLTRALQMFLDIPKKNHRTLFGVLAAILHLGEVQLRSQDEDDDEAGTTFSEDEVCLKHVDQVCDLLGLSRSALLTILTKRHVNFAGTVVAKQLNLEEATAARDAMASQLYNSLFKMLLSSINMKLHEKFVAHRSIFGEEREDEKEERDEEEFDMLACTNIISIYDFPGFEYAKPSNISGLCRNFINEKLYHYYSQNLFRADVTFFSDCGLSVSPISLTSNTDIINLLDNKTSGIFTIFNDQMKLKSKQLDAKVASALYSQHANSAIFDGGKKERKRLWFKVRHYNYAVSYDVKGFKNRNKIQASAEMVEFLRSATVPFVQGLHSYCEVRSSLENPHLHGLEAAPLVEQAVAESLEKSMGRGFTSRPSFRSSLSQKNIILKHQTSDVVSVYSVGQDDESVTSLSSRTSRRGGTKGKPATLASLTQTYMEEVITEISSSQVHAVLCVKPNDVNTCKDFDNYVVSRQIAPYEVLKVMGFYHAAFPFQLSLATFSNRYGVLSLVHKISVKHTKSFTKLLLKCRALGIDITVAQSQNLVKSLLNIVSNLPELEEEFSVLLDKKTNDFYYEAVQTGLKICDNCVFLTALAYFYLESAHKIALNLVAHMFQRFYRQKVRPLIEYQIEKVKHVCRGFVARKSWAKKRVAVVKIQSMVRMFVIRAHYNFERQVLRCIIRIQAMWRSRKTRLNFQHSPPPRPSWMNRRSHPTYHNSMTKGYSTPRVDTDTLNGSMYQSPPGERLDFTPHVGGTEDRTFVKKSYTTEEEQSRSIEEECDTDRDGFVDPLDERGASQFMHKQNPRTLSTASSLSPQQSHQGSMSKHEMKKINELQSQLEAVKLENKALRKIEKKYIEQTKSLNDIQEVDEDEDDQHLGNRSKIIHRQNTANALQAEKLRCAYDNDGTRLLPDYDLYSARVLNAVQDELSFLLKPTIFYKFGHQGSVRKAVICVSPCFHYIMWKPKNSLFKKSDECKIDLRKVWNIAKGQTTAAFKEYKGIAHGPMPPKLSFSLIFGFRSLDLCALDDDTYRLWIQGLQYIVDLINGDSTEAGIDKQYYRSRWNLLDKHRNGVLTRKSVISLVANLGIKFTNDSFLTAILRSSIGNSRCDQVTFSQFCSLVYQLTRRPDLEILWANLVEEDDHSKDEEDLASSVYPLHSSDTSATKLFDVIGIGKFRRFWRRHQGRNLSHNEALLVIQEGMGAKFNSNFPVLSYTGFQAIMNHEKNDLYDPVKVLYSSSEMSRPLCHYYVSTSDGPVVGVEPSCNDDDKRNPYGVDISRGCRCLELRCFQNDKSGVGKKSFQNSLFVSAPPSDMSARSYSFKETISEINRVAFSMTHFPLILFLEFVDPVSMKLQGDAANFLEDVFGDALFLPSDITEGEMLPSPKSLKKRVLIFLTSREKPIDVAYAGGGSKKSSRGDKDKDRSSSSSRRDEWNKYSHDDNSYGSDEYNAKAIDDVDDVLDWYDNPHSFNSPSKQFGNSKDRKSPADTFYKSTPSFYLKNNSMEPLEVHPKLLHICHYDTGGVYRVASHDMSTIVRELKSNPAAGQEIANYNAKHFSHVFMDDQVKVDGSFGRMVQLWDTGVPCVSLCHHLPSLATKLNHGKFRANGGCGFVPKLADLREAGTDMDEDEAYVLVVHVISGQELPDSMPEISMSDLINPNEDIDNDHVLEGRKASDGFSVVLSMHDAMLPIENVEQKTRSVRNHGRNPFWNEVFSFAVRDRNRGQLTMRVFYDNYCQGFTSVPLGCLRQGYRSVSLFHEDECDYFMVKVIETASLFVRVSLCPAAEFTRIRQVSNNKSHESPMRVIKQSKSFSAEALKSSKGVQQEVTVLPRDCGVIKGIPPLNPVRGSYHFEPTPLAVNSAVALRSPTKLKTPSSSMESPPPRSEGTDYRKFNLYGQKSMDGIRTPLEEELDSFEVLQRSVSRSEMQSRSLSMSSTSNNAKTVGQKGSASGEWSPNVSTHAMKNAKYHERSPPNTRQQSYNRIASNVSAETGSSGGHHSLNTGRESRHEEIPQESMKSKALIRAGSSADEIESLKSFDSRNNGGQMQDHIKSTSGSMSMSQSKDSDLARGDSGHDQYDSNDDDHSSRHGRERSHHHHHHSRHGHSGSHSRSRHGHSSSHGHSSHSLHGHGHSSHSLHSHGRRHGHSSSHGRSSHNLHGHGHSSHNLHGHGRSSNNLRGHGRSGHNLLDNEQSHHSHSRHGHSKRSHSSSHGHGVHKSSGRKLGHSQSEVHSSGREHRRHHDRALSADEYNNKHLRRSHSSADDNDSPIDLEELGTRHNRRNKK